MASLELARHGLAFASGLAAEDNVLRLVPSGGRVVLGHDAYGGTFRLIANVWGPHGMTWTRGRPHRPDAARRELAGGHGDGVAGDADQPAAGVHRHRGRRPTSPMPTAQWSSSTTRSPRRTSSSRSGSAPTSSCTRRRSTSAGTATSSAGSSPWTTTSLADRLRFTQNAAGAVPGPFDCYLVLRGVKTLGVRMERHCSNARAVVDLLVRHPAVERVLYPQLPDHPGHAAAAKQMRDFGGMVSFTVPAAPRRPSGSPRPPSCSRSPSRSGPWRA